MSSVSSGIQVTESLSETFLSARNEKNIRFIKVVIDNDQLTLAGTQPSSENISEDFASLSGLVEDGLACYILTRLDSSNEFGNEWAVLSFVPDTSKVKTKMLYASTLDNLRRGLGSTYFAGDLHVTLKSELSFDHFSSEFMRKSERFHATASEVMTEKEKQINEEKTAEVYRGGSTKHVHGVAFQINDAAIEKLTAWASGAFNFISFRINFEKEEIEVSNADANVDANELSTVLPQNEPRYSLYTYAHTFEDSEISSSFFIYSCPEGSKIKERMIYSASKAAVSELPARFGATIAKNLEITDLSDLNGEFLYDEIHPKKVEKKVFKKPTRAGKGAARLHKSTSGTSTDA